jgi:hypothetical protein
VLQKTGTMPIAQCASLYRIAQVFQKELKSDRVYRRKMQNARTPKGRVVRGKAPIKSIDRQEMITYQRVLC